MTTTPRLQRDDETEYFLLSKDEIYSLIEQSVNNKTYASGDKAGEFKTRYPLPELKNPIIIPSDTQIFKL